jgi:uncharacterized protein YecA (UPF0149 family)
VEEEKEAAVMICSLEEEMMGEEEEEIKEGEEMIMVNVGLGEDKEKDVAVMEEDQAEDLEDKIPQNIFHSHIIVQKMEIQQIIHPLVVVLIHKF